jgi:histidinol dehydrogenase
METIFYPPKDTWDGLCKRPVSSYSNLDKPVRSILSTVRSDGDKALREYAKQFDNAVIDEIKVTRAEIDESSLLVPDELKRAIMTAKNNIEKFHGSLLAESVTVETMPGVKCWRKDIPIEKVGLYVPGGSAPLFSTVLMLAIPARLAGCKQVIMCTPPGSKGNVNPVVLYTAMISGITDIYKVGGAQAIAAMAYGTETIPAVFKIFGPGNQYVTKAKEIVLSEGIAIDIPAGPSEAMIIADSSADPGFIAADLLSQAEHGPDSQVVLLTDSRELVVSVKDEIEIQMNALPRKSIAGHALMNSFCILLKDISECLGFSNMYAPEHLIINTRNAGRTARGVINAGSVFIGKYSCESAGDYASGPNHTLPTNRFARTYSGVSTDSFVRKITFQELSAEGMKNIGPVIEAMARAEQLDGHANAAAIRNKKVQNVRS